MQVQCYCISHYYFVTCFSQISCFIVQKNLFLYLWKYWRVEVSTFARIADERRVQNSSVVVLHWKNEKSFQNKKKENFRKKTKKTKIWKQLPRAQGLQIMPGHIITLLTLKMLPSLIKLTPMRTYFMDNITFFLSILSFSSLLVIHILLVKDCSSASRTFVLFLSFQPVKYYLILYSCL